MSTAGTSHVDTVFHKVGGDHAFRQVLIIISDGNQAASKIIITDLDGTVVAEHTRPAPGIRHLGNGRPRGTRPKIPAASPKS